MVAAIPVAVYLTATSEKETPRNGPKKDPSVIVRIAFLSRKAEPILGHNPMSEITTQNPAVPAMIRICDAAKAL